MADVPDVPQMGFKTIQQQQCTDHWPRILIEPLPPPSPIVSQPGVWLTRSGRECKDALLHRDSSWSSGGEVGSEIESSFSRPLTLPVVPLD